MCCGEGRGRAGLVVVELFVGQCGHRLVYRLRWGVLWGHRGRAWRVDVGVEKGLSRLGREEDKLEDWRKWV